MKIQTRQRIATASAFAVIAVIAAALAWARLEQDRTKGQRDLSREVALELSNLRMVTFEYGIDRLERARVQWHAVSRRLDERIATLDVDDPEARRELQQLQARRAAAKVLFAELSSLRPAARSEPNEADARAFETRIFGRLLTGQQESLAHAYRLADLAAAHIVVAERRLQVVTWAGIGLLSLHAGVLSWLFSRRVLAPIERLRDATREVAAGNWTFDASRAGDDEVGDLFRHFDAMVQSLRATFARMEEANRSLAAVNQEMEAFSYSVSHDLRAPLRSLDGFSLVLLEDYGGKLDGEGRDALERIRAASQRMGAIIDDLLRLSRVNRADLNVTPVDLTAMARDIAASLERQAPQRRVLWTIEDGMAIDADPALLRIALQNLLENAWKFTGRTAEARIRVGRSLREGLEEFFVADNGAGFDMAHAGQLFGAFQRLHHVDDFPGTGIGLAIVARIVHRHRGKVRAEARPGEGATFFFHLQKPQEQGHG